MTRAGVTRDEEWEAYDGKFDMIQTVARWCDTWISICCEWQGCPPPDGPGPHHANVPAPGSATALLTILRASSLW